MRRVRINWHRLVPTLFIFAGVATVAVALGADLIGLGDQGGFGKTQIALTTAGFVIALVGCVLAMPPGQRYLGALFGADSRPASLLTMAAWFGLLAGWGETLWLVREYRTGQQIYIGWDFLWMVPLTNLVLFLVVGLVLSIVRWRWPKLISLPPAVFVYAFMAFLNLLLLFERLHRLAAVLLAAGLAVQTARVAAKHAQGFHRFVRYTLGWPVILWLGRGHNDSRSSQAAGTGVQLTRREFLIGAGSTVAGMAVGAQGWQRLVEARALASIPRPSRDFPNVLLVVLDTVRAQSMSLYGYGRPTTPQLARWAKAGVLFERAMAPAPWTLPTHASMFTGRWPHELSTNWDASLDDTYPTLAEVLTAHGYVAAGFVANFFYCTRRSGLDRGFAHYEDYAVTPGQMILSTSLGRTITDSEALRYVLDYYDFLNRRTAAAVNGEFLHWLSRQDHRPFFAFLNYFDVHPPYLPPYPFDVKFDATRERGGFVLGTSWFDREDQWNISPEEVQLERNAYEGAVAYVDHHVGLLLDELEKQGVLENTLVIITSDHGEEFAEHRVLAHGSSLYLPSLYVPLLILSPLRIPAGRRVHQPVTLRDLPATVVDLIGLDGVSDFPGKSLARYWGVSSDAAEPTPEMILSEVKRSPFGPAWYPARKGDIKSLVAGGMHYIKNEGDGREELYDFLKDPWETRDLAGSEEGQPWLERFRLSMERALGLSSGG